MQNVISHNQNQQRVKENDLTLAQQSQPTDHTAKHEQSQRTPQLSLLEKVAQSFAQSFTIRIHKRTVLKLHIRDIK